MPRRPISMPAGKPPAIQELTLTDFSGGMNLGEPSLVEPNEMLWAKNVTLERDGGIEARPLHYPHDSTNRSAMDGNVSNGRKIYNVSWASNNMYLDSADGSNAWTQEYTQNTGNFTTYSVGLFRELIITDLWTFDTDAGAVDVSSIGSAYASWSEDFDNPTTDRLIYGAVGWLEFADRLWAIAAITYGGGVGGDTITNRVHFSHPGTPYAWREDDWIDMPSTITGACVFQDALMLFCQDGIYAIYGHSPSTFQMEKLTGDYRHAGSLENTNGMSAAAEVNNVLFFWDVTSRGVIAYDGQSFTDVFQKVRPGLDPAVWGNTMHAGARAVIGDINPASDDWITPHVQAGPGGVHVGPFEFTWDGATFWGELVFDMRSGAWTVWTFEDSAGSEAAVWFWGRVIDGWVGVGMHNATDAWPAKQDCVMMIEVGTAEPMDSQAKTAWLGPGGRLPNKRWFRPEFILPPSLASGDDYVDVEVFKDWDTETVSRSFTVSADSSVVASEESARGGNIGRAKVISLAMVNNTADEPFEIHGMSLRYQNRGVKRR